jgi:hypothetical protein
LLFFAGQLPCHSDGPDMGMAEREGGGAWGFCTTSAPEGDPHFSSHPARLLPTVIYKIQEGMNTRPLNQRFGL